jgi:hypothetical protein
MYYVAETSFSKYENVCFNVPTQNPRKLKLGKRTSGNLGVSTSGVIFAFISIVLTAFNYGISDSGILLCG